MRPFSFVLFLGVMVILVTACGTGNQAVPDPEEQQPVETPEQPQGNQEEQDQEEQKEPEVSEEIILVYYSTPDLTEMVAEEREISYQQSLEKYKQAIKLLQSPSNPAHATLWKEMAYHDVVWEEGRLTLDLSGENQYNLGSSGEGMALQALTQTLFQFSEVNEIMILEDGEPVESLMGHVELPQPIIKE